MTATQGAAGGDSPGLPWRGQGGHSGDRVAFASVGWVAASAGFNYFIYVALLLQIFKC